MNSSDTDTTNAGTAPDRVRLRPMTPPDLEVVSRLEPELFGAEAWSPAMLAAELDRTAGPGADRTYLVAEAPGRDGSVQIVGYAGLWYGDGGGDADLLTIGTIPSVRRRGVATAMLSALLHAAADAGCRAVLLEVRASNEAAQRLYAAHEFKPIGHRRRYYRAPVEDATVMRRSLRQPADRSA
ncbi:GNAT family N-acetyltransferase [Actinomyces sp. MRS3W]|uniref:GNAT family N-acetyltransferase n=1 Tax=Actinomyces sp. MRS3W TaxID=2800796 RepID=UPI0028FD1369|nr:GNAT family N-acetyltransferase [Actinomyces sp. MRS3W]MDU0349326.1 GNAT family N-acetyltransferase [Actinomyces sp. MRS3W]